MKIIINHLILIALINFTTYSLSAQSKFEIGIVTLLASENNIGITGLHLQNELKYDFSKQFNGKVSYGYFNGRWVNEAFFERRDYRLSYFTAEAGVELRVTKPTAKTIFDIGIGGSWRNGTEYLPEEAFFSQAGTKKINNLGGFLSINIGRKLNDKITLSFMIDSKSYQFFLQQLGAGLKCSVRL